MSICLMLSIKEFSLCVMLVIDLISMTFFSVDNMDYACFEGLQPIASVILKRVDFIYL